LEVAYFFLGHPVFITKYGDHGTTIDKTKWSQDRVQPEYVIRANIWPPAAGGMLRPVPSSSGRPVRF